MNRSLPVLLSIGLILLALTGCDANIEPSPTPDLATPANSIPTQPPALTPEPVQQPNADLAETATAVPATPLKTTGATTTSIEESVIRTGRLTQDADLFTRPGDADPLGRLEAGAFVIVTNSAGNWKEIVYGAAPGGHAWLAESAVTFDPFAEPTAAPMTPTVSSASAAPTIFPAVTGRVTASILNVRGGPGGSQPVVGQLQAGDVVEIIGHNENDEWLAIEWPGQVDGWVAAGYVEMAGELAGLPVLAPALAAAPTPALRTIARGKIAFQTAIGGDIYLLNADGSGLQRVANGLDPALSPDGALLAYARWDAPHAIYLFDLRTGQERQLVAASRLRSPTWSPDGSRLAFSHNLRLYSCIGTPFGCFENKSDLRELLGGQDCISTPGGQICIDDFPLREMSDEGLAQVTLADGSWLDWPSGTAVQAPNWSPRQDEILYRNNNGLQKTSLDGASQTIMESTELGSPAWSPDGQRIVVQMRLHDHADLFLLDAAGNILLRLTEPSLSYERTSAPNNVAPAWSPDGQAILFLSDRDGRWQLYRMNADGSAQTLAWPEVLDQISFKYDFAAERVVSWSR